MRNSSRIPTTCSCGGDVHITPAELQQLKCSWQPSALSCIVLIWQVGKSKCRNIVSGKGASSTRSEPPKKSHRTRVPLLMVMSSLLFLLPILPSAVSSGPAKQLRLLQSQSPRCWIHTWPNFLGCFAWNSQHSAARLKSHSFRKQQQQKQKQQQV